LRDPSIRRNTLPLRPVPEFTPYLRAAVDRHGGNLVVAHALSGPAQARADDAREIARLHAAGAETFGQRNQVVGAECIFEFGQCVEREHQTAPHAADVRLDLTTVTIGHATPP
jgi:hypothetical protein